MNRVFRKILRKIYKLNNHVILFSWGKYIFVTEGLFTGLGVFFGVLLMLVYQASIITNPIHWLIEIFFIGVSGVIGSRGLSALTSYKFIVRDPKKVKYPGFMYYGGLIGGFVGILIFAILYDYPILAVLDAIALTAPLGQFFGRLGCFTYGCCWGKPTKKRWGVIFKNPLSKVNRFKYHPGKKLIPIQIIHAGLLLLLFIFFMIFTNYQLFYGQIISMYFIIHSILRLIMEKYRADTTKIKGNITFTGIISVILIMVGLSIQLFLQPIGANITLQWQVLTNPWTYLVSVIASLIAGIPMSIHYKKVGSW